jgi:hypothetical protein
MKDPMEGFLEMYKGFNIAEEWLIKFNKPMTLGDLNMPSEVYYELEKQFFDRKKENA